MEKRRLELFFELQTAIMFWVGDAQGKSFDDRVAGIRAALLEYDRKLSLLRRVYAIQGARA